MLPPTIWFLAWICLHLPLAVEADAIQEGQALAAELRKLPVGIPGDIQATLKIRKRGGARIERRIQKQTIAGPLGWRDIFQIESGTGSEKDWLLIDHPEGKPPRYHLARGEQFPADPDMFRELNTEQAMTRVGDSDFWAADLGLDFLHWPDQRIVPSRITMRKGVACKVLESMRPTQSSEGYYRVLSWISSKHGGVVYAEAYDIHGKRIKSFEVDDIGKHEGQLYLKQLKIRNMRDRTTSILAFDRPDSSSLDPSGVILEQTP